MIRTSSGRSGGGGGGGCGGGSGDSGIVLEKLSHFGTKVLVQYKYNKQYVVFFFDDHLLFRRSYPLLNQN